MENENPFLLIKTIHDKFEAKANVEGQEAGITYSQMRVLVYLIENQGKEVTQRQMEKFFQISHPTITGILKRMEEKNFITTKLVKEGIQQKYVYITEEGKSALEKMDAHRKNDDESMRKLFSDEELKELKDYLTRILNYLS